jgi:hypothetical protein
MTPHLSAPGADTLSPGERARIRSLNPLPFESFPRKRIHRSGANRSPLPWGEGARHRRAGLRLPKGRPEPVNGWGFGPQAGLRLPKGHPAAVNGWGFGPQAGEGSLRPNHEHAQSLSF